MNKRLSCVLASFLLAASLAVCGCDSTDNGAGGSTNSLVGTWDLTAVTENGQTVNPAEFGYSEEVVFGADGMFNWTIQGESVMGAWTVSGGQLVLTGGSGSMTISFTLTGNTFSYFDADGVVWQYTRR